MYSRECLKTGHPTNCISRSERAKIVAGWQPPRHSVLASKKGEGRLRRCGCNSGARLAAARRNAAEKDRWEQPRFLRPQPCCCADKVALHVCSAARLPQPGHSRNWVVAPPASNRRVLEASPLLRECICGVLQRPLLKKMPHACGPSRRRRPSLLRCGDG